MKTLKKILSILLVLLTLNLYLPKVGFSGSDKAGITEYPPEVLLTPEKKIPVEEIKKEGWGWAWGLLGVLVLVAGVGVALGGGGGADGGGGAGGGGDRGSITVSW